MVFSASKFRFKQNSCLGPNLVVSSASQLDLLVFDATNTSMPWEMGLPLPGHPSRKERPLHVQAEALMPSTIYKIKMVDQ